MAGFQEQLLSAINNRGQGDVADAIGMPDEQDRQMLLSILRAFEAKHPGLIKASRDAGRRDYELGIHGGNKYSLVNKDSGMRYALELPADLAHAIEKVFPSMFRSKKHLRWFCKEFPYLTISGTRL